MTEYIERERLIELIKQSLFKHIYKSCNLSENISDDLIANGVIVPPCKVGDVVYRKDDKKVYDWWQIEHIEIYFDEIVFVDDSGNRFTPEDIGKTVFLTRKEAEKALEVSK